MSKIDILLDLYSPSPAKPLITDQAEVQRLFKHWRLRMLASMFIGYGILYFGRKNISAALPVMATDLGYTNLQLGILGSTLYIVYGLGKFLNGVMADRANIRVFMASSLILSGVTNLWFGSLISLWALAFAWGVNGWVQSMGFPPVAKSLTIWYEAHGKSTRWAIWTCSHQAGTAAIMALVAVILAFSGNNWRLCFYIPGVLCLLTGIGLLFSMADTPESQGLPKVHYFDPDDGARRQEENDSYWQIFVRRVLVNRQLWVIAMVNLCVYIVRCGTLDWTTKFLVERKGYTVATAAGMASAMPLFGIAGVLVTGWLADKLFNGTFRTLNIIMLAGLGVALAAFYGSPGGNQTVDLMFLAAIGLFIEGPQSVLGGIIPIDVSGSARVASSSAGLVGICGYFGATLSSLGTGYFLDRFGWGGGFVFWTACAAIGFLLCVFSWRRPHTR